MLPAGAVVDLGHQLLVDRAPHGWWYAMASDEATTVAYCTDGDLVGTGAAGVRQTWRNACALAEWLPPAVGRQVPRLRSRTIGYAGTPSDATLRLVGDAALAVDPLSGHGVALAVEAGVRWSDHGYSDWLREMAESHEELEGAAYAAVDTMRSTFWVRR